MLSDRRTAAAFVAVVFLGGLNAVAVRGVDRELAPLWGAALRFGIAAAVVLFIAVGRRAPWPRGRALVGSIVYGGLGFGTAFGLIHLGLVHTPAAIGQILLATVPMLTFVIAVGMGMERFDWRGLLGVLVALVGIAVVFSSALALSVDPGSAFALLGATGSMAAANIVVKRLPKPDPIVHNAIGMSVGAVLLAAWSATADEPWALPATVATSVALAYLALLGSAVVFVLFVFLISRWTASAASYVMLLTPLVTVVAAALVSGEQPTPGYWLGGALVLGGVAVGLVNPRRKVRQLPAIEMVQLPAGPPAIPGCA